MGFGTNLEAERISTFDSIEAMRRTLNSVIRGKESAVELVLACLLSGGHLLLEDLPGLGKTTLAKTLSYMIGGKFSRLQCTPDLMPNDITGFYIFNQKTREFEFNEGPIFSDVLLADEINRTTPRTQSALFEAMSERQVTIDRTCHILPETFFVIATQNPVDYHGVYPLPEAQLDRFAMKLSLGYPSRTTELDILARDIGRERRVEAAEHVITPTGLSVLQERVSQIVVGEKVRGYLVDLAAATRGYRDVTLGLSPRGLLTWQRVVQARAFLMGRDFATPDDVQDVALPVLSVRLVGEFSSAETVVQRLLNDIPTPVIT